MATEMDDTQDVSHPQNDPKEESSKNPADDGSHAADHPHHDPNNDNESTNHPRDDDNPRNKDNNEDDDEIEDDGLSRNQQDDEEDLDDTERGGDDDDDEDAEDEDEKEDDDEDSRDEEEKDEDESDHDDSSDDDDGGLGDDPDGGSEDESKKIVTEDGREISEYEFLRLERIRRNKEKLAQLGLEGQGGGGVLGERKKFKKKRQLSEKKKVAPKRSSLSRESKGKVTHYAAELPSVRQLLKGETVAKKEKKEPKERKTKDPSERMDRVLHHEFRAIRAQKKFALRQAERDNRSAIKEVKYWTKQVAVAKRREVREQKRQEVQLHVRLEEERGGLGGKTARQILQEVDKRMPELLEAAEEYDEIYEAEARQRQRELERFEMEERMKCIEALERYPKTLKESSSLLSAVLVERAPKDPPPPRRSKRAGDDADEQAEQPKKKKAKTKPKESESWSEQVPISAVSIPITEEDASTQTKIPAAIGKKRKRGVRNVGGWVSPDFAQNLDRSWLERDVPGPKFDLKSFVPQVGDALLYYPKGHYEFLSEYPDILGKKTRQSTRVPLWERRHENNNGDEKEEDEQVSSWCTEEWAGSIGDEKQGGRYPILCTVQTVCAEFPPDPSTKVVKNKEGADGETVKKIFFKKSKDGLVQDKAKIRLAVTLRPLSPVFPGLGLTLPPMFSVVTFPSKMKPFLVPFAWAYSLNHGMQFGTTVVRRTNIDSLMRISKIDVPPSLPNEGRIDPTNAKCVLGVLGEENARRESLTKLLSEDSRQLPLCDALVALSTFENIGHKGGLDAETTDKVGFIDLICDTLPVWDAAVITSKDVYDRKKMLVQTVSPWELCVVQKGYQPHEATPDAIAELPSRRDDSLRMKLEVVLDEVVKDHPSGSLFADPVTEEIAPSYFCAVPVGMSVSRIQKRLRGSQKTKTCAYRSIGAILSDVSAIVENCLLYNSPDSEVVEAATEVTAMLKDGISRVVREHNKEVSALLKKDEERRRHVMQLCGSGTNSSNRSLVEVCRIKKPYKQSIYQDWLQETMTSPQSRVDSQEIYSIPQAGDEIHYSRSRHSKFVKGHHSALELNQCEVVSSGESFAGEIEDLTDDWSTGRVVWTKAVFPRPLAKKDAESGGFQTNATLLAVGVSLKDDLDRDKVHIIYWRPCMFCFDREPSCPGQCNVCGLSTTDSFLRIDSGQRNGYLGAEESKSIEQALSLLKKRVLHLVPPSYIDPGLTKSSIKQGYKVPGASHGLQSLPSYENLMATSSPVANHHTRKVNVRFEAPPAAMVQSGFLASWMSENPKQSKDPSPKQHETVSPWPKMCLELVRLRVKSGYYHNRLALENDLIEAFSSTALLLVADAANQKKTPLSVRKVTKILSSQKGRSESDGNKDESSKLDSEEEKRLVAWVEKLRPIRDLYSAALAAITDTERFERINGLYKQVEPIPKATFEPVASKQQNSVQIHAREKLRRLLEAVAKDPLSPEFIVNKKGPGDSAIPTTKLSVICGGRRTEYETFTTTIKRAVAKVNEKDVKVKILCNGTEQHVQREVPRKSTIDATLDGTDVKVRVVANGEEIFVPDASKLRRSSDVKEVIHDYLPIGAKELDGSETLVRFLFGRPGRMSVCARCSAHRRNALICRVRRAHANMDFDWLDFFQDIDGIDDILESMKSGETKTAASEKSVGTRIQSDVPVGEPGAVDSAQKCASVTSNSNKKLPSEEAKKPLGRDDGEKEHNQVEARGWYDVTVPDSMEGASTAPTTRTYSTRRSRATSLQEEIDRGTSKVDAQDEEDKEAAKSTHDGDGDKEDAEHAKTKTPISSTQIDLEECLVKAETVLKLSEVVLDEARRFAKAPPRLSKDFVEAQVPIDKADGHYIYCIICGLSGNLLCCDGCANVVHSGCIELETVPEGEWFCEECSRKKAADPDKSNSEANSMHKLPFGRFNFDQARADRLTAQVQELHDMRPDVAVRREREKKKKAQKANHSGDSDSEDSEDEGHAIDPSDPLSALNNTAKSFLASIGITGYEDFLSARTFVLADKFSKWRKKNKMPELRGSGPTAYISQWKRICRDMAEQGQEVDEDGDNNDDSDSDDDRSRRRVKKKALRSPGRRLKKTIEDPLDALSSQSKEFLKSIGIEDTAGFLDTRTTDIAQKFVKWRKKLKLPRLKSNGEVATVSAWKTAVRSAEETLKSTKKSRGKTPPSTPSTQTKKIDTAAGRAERAMKRKERIYLDTPNHTGAKLGSENDPESSDDEEPFEDPLDALTATARDFLRDERIRSADEFLSLRSGEIGDRFGAWRKKKGLPKLRGSGEGATISAWKTLCRKAVAALERYKKKVQSSSNIKRPEGQEVYPAARTGNTTDGSQVLEMYDALPAVSAVRRSRRKRKHMDTESEANDGNEETGGDSTSTENAQNSVAGMVQSPSEEPEKRKRTRRSRH